MGIFTPLSWPGKEILSEPRAEAKVSDYCVPYTVAVDEHTLKTHEGDFLQIIRFAGFPFETAENSEVNLRKRVRNQLWKSINSSNIAVYHHIVRRENPVYPEGAFPAGSFAQELDARWKQQISSRKMYTNDLYITVIHKRGAGTVHSLQNMVARFSHKVDKTERKRHEAKVRASLEDATRTILELFKPYWPERIKIETDSQGRVLCEQMRFLGFLINLIDQPYVLPEHSIGKVLPSSRVVFKHEVAEVHQATRTLYAAMLSVKEYDAATAPNMFDKLLGLPMEFVVTQSFRFEERILSEFEIERQKGRLRSTADKGMTQISELSYAFDDTKGSASFGLHHHTVMVWDERPELLSEKIAQVDSEFAEQGITCVRENVNLPAAFYAQLPGNFQFVTRGARISTKNFASFASGHNYAGGRRNALWGPAITVFPTISRTPYYFNLHVGDRGNTLVLGPTGQGKTLTMSFLFSQSLKLGGRRVFLDKDRGMEIFIRASGGNYSLIGNDQRTGWNPLQLPDSPAQRNFLNDFFEALLTDNGGESLDADDRQRIKRVVTAVFDLPHSERVLRHIAPMFGSPEQDKLGKRLLDWYSHPLHGDGRFAWLFDNNENTLDLSNPIIGFDLTYILDLPRARPSVLLWIFHVIESLIDGQPMAMFADEGWRLLQDELVMRRLENFEFVIRKNNGLLAFATQTPETVMNSPIAPALKQQSETLILFPNVKAEEEVYCGYLGLNATQFDLIKYKLAERAEPGWFLVKNSLGAAICRLNLSGMDDYIAVLSGNKNTVHLLDELRRVYGDDPQQWLPEFYSRWRSVSAMGSRDTT